jgi:uncharacterized protein with GYD domain
LPTYVALLTWTDQGVRNAKDTIKRYDAAMSVAQKLGVSIRNTWWTMGTYDAITVLEAPDEASASRFAIAISGQGNVRTLTMRAYTKEEMAKIVSSLP